LVVSGVLFAYLNLYRSFWEMSVLKGQIPGLYSADKNLDWSSDDIKHDNQNDANNSLNMDTSQTRDNNILSEMRMEKDNLGLNFVHAHRLLDAGKLRILFNTHPTWHVKTRVRAIFFLGRVRDRQISTRLFRL